MGVIVRDIVLAEHDPVRAERQPETLPEKVSEDVLEQSGEAGPGRATAFS